MGKITESAAKTFKRRRNVHVPAFFTWAQYVALALIPIFYFSYFMLNKPGSYAPPKNVLVLQESASSGSTTNTSANSSQDMIQTEPSGTNLISITLVNGGKTEIDRKAFELAKLVALAYFNGDWGKINVLGSVPAVSTINPKAKVISLIAYNCEVSSCVLGANVDKNGDGVSDESIQFTLIAQNGQWFYEGN